MAADMAAPPIVERTVLADPAPGRILAQTGTPLGESPVRQRPVPPIGARIFAFPAGHAAVHVSADCDCCRLDGAPVQSNDDWAKVLASGRLADVRGAFALAWSDGSGALHLARDGIGERTLFYAARTDTAVYGSSIKAMLATGLVARELNLPAVATYLSYAYLPGRETLIQGLFEVLPGEHVRIDVNGVRRQPFWSVRHQGEQAACEADLTAELRATLETAVRRRLPPPGETVGAFLSGGLDSSLIVALAKRLHDGPLETYSVFFGTGSPNELEFSSMVAAHCGTNHHIVELTPAAVLRHLDDTIALLSDPIGDPLTVPNALLFREAAGRTGVILNGEGGDPCFGGPKNLPMVLAELYTHLDPVPSREASFLRAHLKCYDDLPQMVTAKVRDALQDAPLEAAIAPMLSDPEWPDFIARLQAMNIAMKGAHHILPKVDALSAPFGVLPRRPLFDRDVVELAMRTPSALKLHGSVEKYILKQAVRDLLPEAIIARPKSGMLVPVEGWFRGPLLPAGRERLLDGLAPYGLFERAYLERLLSGQLGGIRPRHGAKIWLLVTLEAWLRRVFTA